MSTIQFENGVRVKFNGTPTPQDIEEVARRMGAGGQQVPQTGAQPSPIGTQSPQTPDERVYASPLQRMIMSFGDDPGREKYMQERGITDINKPGFELGDITGRAGGMQRSMLGLAGMMVGGKLGALGGSAVAPGPGTAVGGFTGGVAGGAAGEMAGERYRQAIGDLLGVYSGEGDVEELKSAAITGGISSAVTPVAGKLLKGVLGGTTGTAYKKAFKPALRTIDKYRKQGIDLPKEWADLGVWGTKKQVNLQFRREYRHF